MSLIDEALKRARLEAAQRAAESEGLPYPTIPRHLAPPRRRRWLAPAVVALAVIAGLLIGLLLASRPGSRPDRVAAAGVGAEPLTSGPATAAEVERDPPAATDPAEPESSSPGGPHAADPAPSEPSPREAPPAARPVTSGPTGPVELVRDPSRAAEAQPDEGAAERRAIRTRPDAPPAAEIRADGGVPASPERPSPRVETPPPPAAEPAAPAVVSPAPPSVEPTAALPARSNAPLPESQSATSTVTDPDSGVLLVLPRQPEPEPAAGGSEPAMPVESHVQSFPLPDGGAIELGGIAWSETGPFALINGRVVGPGSAVGDYTLERIQQGHVELVGNGRRVHLSLQ